MCVGITDGQCGQTKQVKNINTPTQISFDFNNCQFQAISVGNEFNLCLDKQGNIWSFGLNMDNQCGLYNNNGFNIYRPQMIDHFYQSQIEIIAISTGSEYSLCIDNEGNTYSFGDNTYFQCGHKGTNNLDIFGRKILIHRINIDNNNNKERIEIIQISSGGYHSLLLSECNNIYAFGANDYHQCSSQIDSQTIAYPYKLDKYLEFGDDKCYIERVIGLNNETVIIIDPHQ